MKKTKRILITILDEDDREWHRTERDYRMHWLIKYDRLPPRAGRSRVSRDWMIALPILIPLYAYGLYKMFTYH